jgi:DNA-binding HxlR family transcriptional regulator
MAAMGGQRRDTWGSNPRHPRAHRSWTPLGRALTAAGDHWTLLIVLQLANGRMRLSELQRCLPGVSTGVLERYVQQMEALELLTRTRYKEMPPRVELELTEAGRALLPIAIALARWGMLHMWSQPREGESVGIELLLRALPFLVEDAVTVADGAVQALVIDGRERPACVGYRIRGGRVRIEHAIESEHAVEHADSRVEGDTSAWIDALGPTADYGRLTFAGERQLAIDLLDSLPRRISSAPLTSR